MDIFNYSRRNTHEVLVGDKPSGGDNPIRIQSMTNTSTMDTNACVQQILSLVKTGCEYVRLTTQGVREAENLGKIKEELLKKGCQVPLIADVHFNPEVADVASDYVEKVRINPGNYVDPIRTFQHLEYTDEEYERELEKIKERLVPFLEICKKNHTAIRLGVNHGSLSDRIMSRYGDTPEGMVESCMEFLRVCVARNFKDVVISIKASNTVLMVCTVRLLVEVMERENMSFPLHLGVTEAGNGEEGRIKSAVGIGALLADGIGDTIRVSLSEAPEAEIPVARKLALYVSKRAGHSKIWSGVASKFNYLNPTRRETCAVGKIGGGQVPAVIGMQYGKTRKFNPDFIPDYIYCPERLPEERQPGVAYLIPYLNWKDEENCYPIFNAENPLFLKRLTSNSSAQKFLIVPYVLLTDKVLSCLREHPEVVVIARSYHLNPVGEYRAIVHKLMRENISNPVIINPFYDEVTAEGLQIKAGADLGVLLIDGLADGLVIDNYNTYLEDRVVDGIAFGILQATRSRISKTEYISCPGCGRTLYDLQSTIQRIKAATSHLKGLKIAIMGCIVNGPGEMADADYGYVGAARGKVSLYRKSECVERNIPEAEAVDKLLKLIQQNEQ